MIEVTDEQAAMHNDLIDLCRDLTGDRPEHPHAEMLDRIKSLVQGKHMNDRGLYWHGVNLRP